jgi:hypothetical protein
MNLICGNPVKMLITDTREGRDTKVLVVVVSKIVSTHHDAMASVINVVNSITEDLSSFVALAAGGIHREGGNTSRTRGDKPRFASVYGGQALTVVVAGEDFQRFSYGEGN